MKWEAPKQPANRVRSEYVNWAGAIETATTRPGKWLLAKELKDDGTAKTSAAHRTDVVARHVRNRYSDVLETNGVEVLTAPTKSGGRGIFMRAKKS